MKKLFILFGVFLLLSVSGQVSALTLDLIETGDDPVVDLSAAILASGSGISIIGGTETFVGRVGNGNLAQSATYTGFDLTSSGPGPSIINPAGIFLTTGSANLPFTNTSASWDHNILGITNPGTGADADLTAILIAAGAPDFTTNDVNFFSFDFTAASGRTSVSADFVFGSDEFPDQSVTDVFAFIVDGENFAFFPDGSLVSFVTGVNASNFNDNDIGTGNYPLEYDGISNSLHVTGILDPNLSTHTIKIAIADTTDNVFDSGVFLGNLRTGTATGSGGIGATVPEPTTMLLFGFGLLGAAGLGRRKK
jgi:hypothetical protein